MYRRLKQLDRFLDIFETVKVKHRKFEDLNALENNNIMLGIDLIKPDGKLSTTLRHWSGTAEGAVAEAGE